MENKILNYSEVLYLNAEKYAPEASLLQNKEELPNGKKLNIVKLGNMEAEAAFAYLYFSGAVGLELSSKKILGFIPKKVVVVTKKSDGAGLSGLEKAIFDRADGLDTHTILRQIIGEECPVPWATIINIVKESLVKKEFLNKEEITKKVIVSFVTYKYHLNESININLKEDLAELNEKLKEFSKLDFYDALVKSISAAILSQKEQPDSDSD